jgi:transcriptional regulator with XRE-family HTH domain
MSSEGGRRSMGVEAVGHRIKHLRRQKGWTQTVLSEAAGLPQATISRIEAGKVKQPSIRTLRRIADTLGVKLESIIESRQLSLDERLNSMLKDKRGQEVIRVFSGVSSEARQEFERFAQWIEEKYRHAAPDTDAASEEQDTEESDSTE